MQMLSSVFDLSIAVVSWNTKDLLTQCLEAVYATLHDVTFEVLVIDNASADGSTRAVRERFPQVKLIENRVNLGFAYANNQAIAVSQGRFILLLNSDTIVQPNALASMVSFMQSRPEAGIVGPLVLNVDGTPQRCYGAFPDIFSESIYAWGLDSRWPLSRWFGASSGFLTNGTETGWVLGAALMIRREALEKVGFLDDSYFMYSEEIDLAYRVRKAGWRNFVLGCARIIHLGGQSTQQNRALMKAELFRSKVRYFRKHHGAAAAGWMIMVFSTSIWAKWLAYYLLGKSDVSKSWAETWSYLIHARQEATTARAD